MARTAKHWTLKSYTNGAWTDLVAEASTLVSIILANTGASPIAVQARLTDAAGVETAVVLPTTSVEGNKASRLDLASLSLQANTKLQVQAAAAGVHFTATGIAGA